MTVRAVEGKLPYTGGKAITVDENKVISLNLRDENNLIIYDQGDNEIYVDLQLPDGIRPNYAFPVGITTGRVLVADDWDVTGTIIVAKTTSGDVIKLLYGDDGTLWMDNGTGLFKQIYFKADVDLIITNLTTYINTQLALKQDKLIAGTNIQIANDGKTISATDTTYGAGTGISISSNTINNTGVLVSTDTGNLLSTGVKLWLGDKADFDNLGTLDTNTIYAPITGMGGGGGYTPGANTVAYFPFIDDALDHSGNNYTLISTSITQQSIGYLAGGICKVQLGNTTVRTVMGYINIQSYQASQADHYVECFRHSNYYVQYYKYHGGDSSLTNKFVVFTNSSYSSDTGSYTLNTGEWHHIALVNDIENSKTYGYADGVKIFEGAGAYNFNISDVFLRADRDSSNTPKTGTALLSECIIEDKAWTAQEIQDYYNNTKSTYGS